MKQFGSKTTKQIQIHIQGQLSTKTVFVDGIYIYTRDYWLSLTRAAQERLENRHNGIRSFFSDCDQ